MLSFIWHDVSWCIQFILNTFKLWGMYILVDANSPFWGIFELSLLSRLLERRVGQSRTALRSSFASPCFWLRPFSHPAPVAD